MFPVILNNFYFFHRQNIGDGYGWVRTGTDGWTNTLDSIRMGTERHGGMDKHLGQYTDGYGGVRTGTGRREMSQTHLKSVKDY